MMVDIPAKMAVFGESSRQRCWSIVIPTFRRIGLLEQALKSAIDQDFSCPYEIVVSNNDETDHDAIRFLISTFPLPQHVQIVLYSNAENVGMVGNWNYCLQRAAADWCTFLADDDVLHPRHLKVLEHVLSSARSGVSFISFQRQIFGDKPPEYCEVDSMNCLHAHVYRVLDFISSNPVVPANVSVNRVINKLDFSAEMYPSFDYHFFARKALAGERGLLVDLHMAYHRFGSNESVKKETVLGFLDKDYRIRKLVMNALFGFSSGFINSLFKAMHADFYIRNRYIGSDEMYVRSSQVFLGKVLHKLIAVSANFSRRF